MNRKFASPFLRPFVGALGFLIFFCIYIPAQGRELSLAKVGVVSSWFLLSTVILGGVQVALKKEFGWIVSTIGVVVIAMLIAAIMLSLKSGQVFTR